MSAKRHINPEHEALLCRLLEEYSKKLYHLCKVFYPYDRTLRDQLYNDAVYRLWRSLGQFDPAVDPWPWMFRLTIRAAATLRRRNRLTALFRTITPADADIPLADDAQRTMLDELYRLIDKLDPTDRALAYLYIDRVPQARMAEITGLSETNVSTRIGRIKVKLKKMHDNGEGDI